MMRCASIYCAFFISVYRCSSVVQWNRLRKAKSIDAELGWIYALLMWLQHWLRQASFWHVLVMVLSAQPAVGLAGGLLEVRPWRDYRTIMWVGDTAYRHPEKLPLFFQRLREMGINTAMVYGEQDPRPLLDNHFPYYVENLVNRGLCLKFNSNVKDWDKMVTEWARNGRPESALVRDYCLEDPAWVGSAQKVVESIVRKNEPNGPLAYNIRDELSTTISANPFDYDFNPIALQHFRAWLKTQYSDLSALNAEWQTRFESWDDVKPFTTDQIKKRMVTGDSLPQEQPDWAQLQRLHFDSKDARELPEHWNFSPWADFRTYMDVSLASALDNLRQTARAIDPRTPVGIEGTQMPHAFGGYDLWRLSQAIDWVEPYDIGCARAIFGSFMPGKPILTTVFETETGQALRRLWHLLLEGDRGCLVWWSEDCLDWKSPDLSLTAKAQALAPALREMTSPLAKLFVNAKREYDPVLIHYSQPSIQVDWLIESTVDGSTWLRRFSSFEADHNQMAKTRATWLKGLQDLGYNPQFISSEQVELGKLSELSSAVLIFPGSWALSQKESATVMAWLGVNTVTSGFREVFAEGPVGIFDEHGKLQQISNLEDALPGASANQGCLALGSKRGVSGTAAASREYLSARLRNGSSSWLEWVRSELQPMQPEVSVAASAHTRVHRFAIKRGRLLAFERNIEYHMSEDLKEAGGNEALEKPVEIEAVLRTPSHVYDLRAGKYLGFVDHLHFTLDPWRPSLFALLREKVPAESALAELEKDLER
jgi:hypothetical protein